MRAPHRLALGHRGDDGLTEILRVRAREADPLDSVDGVDGPEQLAELGSISGRRSRPHELTFWPRSVTSRTPSAARRVTSATISPGRRLCSRPRTDGTMQYAHLELQPIEICTQAWKRRSRCIGQLGREDALLCDPEAAALHPGPAGAEPVAEVRDRARPEGDVDERIELEEPAALRFGVAAADGDHALRIALLHGPSLSKVRSSRWSGFSRIVQVLKTSTSASAWDAASPRPSSSSMPLIRSES